MYSSLKKMQLALGLEFFVDIFYTLCYCDIVKSTQCHIFGRGNFYDIRADSYNDE